MSSHNRPPDTAHHYRQEIIERVFDTINEDPMLEDKTLLHAAATFINLVRYPEDELQERLDMIDTDEEATELILSMYAR
jgi:hypothetical protein